MSRTHSSSSLQIPIYCLLLPGDLTSTAIFRQFVDCALQSYKGLWADNSHQMFIFVIEDTDWSLLLQRSVQFSIRCISPFNVASCKAVTNQKVWSGAPESLIDLWKADGWDLAVLLVWQSSSTDCQLYWYWWFGWQIFFNFPNVATWLLFSKNKASNWQIVAH